MYARYQKGKRIFIAFDLENAKDLGAAFCFFHGGAKATPFINDAKARMEQMLEALKIDVIEDAERKDECSHFDICHRCGMEIQLDGDNHMPSSDHPTFLGIRQHKYCPVLKPRERRNF